MLILFIFGLSVGPKMIPYLMVQIYLEFQGVTAIIFVFPPRWYSLLHIVMGI